MCWAESGAEQVVEVEYEEVHLICGGWTLSLRVVYRGTMTNNDLARPNNIAHFSACKTKYIKYEWLRL